MYKLCGLINNYSEKNNMLCPNVKETTTTKKSKQKQMKQFCTFRTYGEHQQIDILYECLKGPKLFYIFYL